MHSSRAHHVPLPGTYDENRRLCEMQQNLSDKLKAAKTRLLEKYAEPTIKTSKAFDASEKSDGDGGM
jgi:hypothetical protein